MIRIAITAAVFEAIAATLLTAFLLAGAASARAESIHGPLSNALSNDDWIERPKSSPPCAASA